MDKRIDCNSCPLNGIGTDELCEGYCSDMADFIDEIRADAIAEISREMRVLYGNEYERQIRENAIKECREAVNEILRYYRNEYKFGVTFNVMCSSINDKIEQMQKGE